MAKQYKTSHKAYFAWNYEEEIEDLNRASAKGWQLIRGGCFSSRFVKNPDVEYRYQMDFRKIEDMGRYIETFREQGWEYVSSTFNGWHYFRKLYDPALPAETYEIFTDRESIEEMNGRWTRFGRIIGGLCALMALIAAVRMILWPHLPALVQLLTLAAESFVLLRGAAIMKNQDDRRNRRSGSALFPVFFAVVLIGAIGSIAATELRPHFETSQRTDSIDAPIVDNRWCDFEIHYPDNYLLDLEIEADKPLTFAIVNAAGEAVYSVTETDFEGEDIRLKLKRGHYQLSLSAESGFEVECSLD
ncbi:MAG: DUF2812 domain-containing protein [Lachnospiraceae bacterium]|nr:DUF2812 domain-containing protein [Lachnospiraceae bacterium]